jgi:hypothetical protein
LNECQYEIFFKWNEQQENDDHSKLSTLHGLLIDSESESEKENENVPD